MEWNIIYFFFWTEKMKKKERKMKSRKDLLITFPLGAIYGIKIISVCYILLIGKLKSTNILFPSKWKDYEKKKTYLTQDFTLFTRKKGCRIEISKGGGAQYCEAEGIWSLQSCWCLCLSQSLLQMKAIGAIKYKYP